MVFDDDGAAVFEVEDCLEGCQMAGCSVGVREVVEEETRLEEGVFYDLEMMLGRENEHEMEEWGEREGAADGGFGVDVG